MITNTQPNTLAGRLGHARKMAQERFGRLDCDTITVKPVDVDWAEAFQYGEDSTGRAELVYPDWSVLELAEVLDYIDERDSTDAEDFRRRLVGLDEDDTTELAELELIDKDHERAAELREERDDTREEEEDVRDEINDRAGELAIEGGHEWEPAMNYAYPLPAGRGFDPAAAQAKLMGEVGCVVVVLIDDEPHLALSGGGMDLSWEICHAFALLGFRPPLHFSELPNIAGRGQSDGDLAILGVCLESAEIAAKWAQNTVDRLSERIR